MGKISDLFEKYEKYLPQDTIIRDKLVVLIRSRTGIIVDRTMISISNNKVYIKALPIVKSEIVKHHEFLINELNKELELNQQVNKIL